MRMPFGKHKGVDIAMLPDDYLDWLNSRDLHGALALIVAREHRLRFNGSSRRHDWRPQETRAELPPPPRVPEIIDAGFKALSKKHHPDVGGSNDAMRETLEARAYLIKRFG